MTITADARSSASTAAGPPTSSPVSDGAPHTDVVSPYGTALSAPDQKRTDDEVDDPGNHACPHRGRGEAAMRS